MLKMFEPLAIQSHAVVTGFHLSARAVTGVGERIRSKLPLTTSLVPRHYLCPSVTASMTIECESHHSDEWSIKLS